MEKTLIARIADEIEKQFVFPDLGQKLARKLRTQTFRGLAEAVVVPPPNSITSVPFSPLPIGK